MKKLRTAVALANRRLASLPGGKRCPICCKPVARFLPYRDGSAGLPPLMAALECVGSDIDNFECPSCGATDRDRHLYLYMQQADLFAGLAGKTVVHFAPEASLARLIKPLAVSYVACDMFPSSEAVQREDLTRMSFADASVDLLIANHVLEHVADDRAAIAEIRRVLKPGGHAILQTPYSPMLERTWEDPGIRSETARLQAYGQEDHVRLFGRDIFERFANGMAPCVKTHSELLPEVDPGEVGVNPAEPFFLFRRDSRSRGY